MAAPSPSISEKPKIDVAKYLVLMKPDCWYTIHEIARLRGSQKIGRLLHSLRHLAVVESRGAGGRSFKRITGTTDPADLPCRVASRCWSTDEVSKPQALLLNSLQTGSIIVVGECFKGAFVLDKSARCGFEPRPDVADLQVIEALVRREILVECAKDDFATYFTLGTTPQ